MRWVMSHDNLCLSDSMSIIRDSFYANCMTMEFRGILGYWLGCEAAFVEKLHGSGAERRKSGATAESRGYQAHKQMSRAAAKEPFAAARLIMHNLSPTVAAVIDRHYSRR